MYYRGDYQRIDRGTRGLRAAAARTTPRGCDDLARVLNMTNDMTNAMHCGHDEAAVLRRGSAASGVVRWDDARNVCAMDGVGALEEAFEGAAKLPLMSQLDFAPTLSLLLGLPIPYGSVGARKCFWIQMRSEREL